MTWPRGRSPPCNWRCARGGAGRRPAGGRSLQRVAGAEVIGCRSCATAMGSTRKKLLSWRGSRRRSPSFRDFRVADVLTENGVAILVRQKAFFSSPPQPSIPGRLGPGEGLRLGSKAARAANAVGLSSKIARRNRQRGFGCRGCAGGNDRRGCGGAARPLSLRLTMGSSVRLPDVMTRASTAKGPWKSRWWSGV